LCEDVNTDKKATMCSDVKTTVLILNLLYY